MFYQDKNIMDVDYLYIKFIYSNLFPHFLLIFLFVILIIIYIYFLYNFLFYVNLNLINTKILVESFKK